MEKISLQSLEKCLFSLKEEWKFYFQFPFKKNGSVMNRQVYNSSNSSRVFVVKFY